AIYNILLSRLSGSEDIIMGTPTAGRRHADLMPIVGMFVNTLPLRNFPGANKTFIGFLADLKTDTLAAFENQDYQFETLVNELEVPRDTSRNPLFDAFFSMQNIDNPHKGATVFTGGIGELGFREETVSKFDISLNCKEDTAVVQVSFEYCRRLFKRETMERFAGYFKRIITAVLETPNMKPAEIDILSQQEKQFILYESNDTAMDYPAEKMIHQLFREQVEKNPHHTAVSGKSSLTGRNSHITYGELFRRSGQLSVELEREGVTGGTI
ncbi:MAG: non-ribosomal peptide synthetase, partial [bacterium]|nr:non-ribosomal peptide synthetase [bacterium]